MKIAFDIKEMKVGCVLLQSAMGGYGPLCHEFDTAHWLLFPTPDMKLYEVTFSQVKELVAKAERHHYLKERV